MVWPTLNSSLGDTLDVITKAQQEGNSEDKLVRLEPAMSPENFLRDAPSDAEDEESPREEFFSTFDIRLQRQNLPRLDTNVQVSSVLRATNPGPTSPKMERKAINEHNNFASPNLGSPSVSKYKIDTSYQRMITEPVCSSLDL